MKNYINKIRNELTQAKTIAQVQAVWNKLIKAENDFLVSGNMLGITKSHIRWTKARLVGEGWALYYPFVAYEGKSIDLPS